MTPTQRILPLAGPTSIEEELQERCPLVTVECSTELRNRFDWCIARGERDGVVVISVEKQFWSQTKRTFIEKYDAEVSQ